MTTGEPSALNNYLAQVNTLGHAVLIETIKMAVYYVHHSSINSVSKNFKTDLREAKSCYLYVQGTGLDITINKFGMDYDADRIKGLFNYLVRTSI